LLDGAIYSVDYVLKYGTVRYRTGTDLYGTVQVPYRRTVSMKRLKPGMDGIFPIFRKRRNPRGKGEIYRYQKRTDYTVVTTVKFFDEQMHVSLT
jgi:hypothetical protein